MSKKVLAVDLGGTKILAAIVDSTGSIIKKTKQTVDASAGPVGVLGQIAALAKQFRADFPEITVAALASAGPLDPVKGLWLSPTNITTNGEHWGAVPVVSSLDESTGLKWSLENDAAAAIRAEVWTGRAKGEPDAMAITLGTGVGVGVWANGALIRAGRNLHPEGGHLIIEHVAKEVVCGCGNWGCSEAYLSGANFTKWMGRKWGLKLSGEDLLKIARSGDQKAVEEFHAYGRRLAIFISSLVVLFCPRVIVISGGFSHAADLFLPTAKHDLQNLLSSRRKGEDLLPHILVSEFQDEAGVLGAAHIALQKLI